MIQIRGQIQSLHLVIRVRTLLPKIPTQANMETRNLHLIFQAQKTPRAQSLQLTILNQTTILVQNLRLIALTQRALQALQAQNRLLIMDRITTLAQNHHHLDTIPKGVTTHRVMILLVIVAAAITTITLEMVINQAQTPLPYPNPRKPRQSSEPIVGSLLPQVICIHHRILLLLSL